MALSRSRLVALGLSVGATVGLVVGMAATARPQATPEPVAEPAEPAPEEPVAAVPATSPFAGRPAITQSGAS